MGFNSGFKGLNHYYVIYCQLHQPRQLRPVMSTLVVFWFPSRARYSSLLDTILTEYGAQLVSCLKGIRGPSSEVKLAVPLFHLRLRLRLNEAVSQIPVCVHHMIINLLKPTGYVMHHQFNIQQLYALPTPYLYVLYLSENKQRLVPLTA